MLKKIGAKHIKTDTLEIRLKEQSLPEAKEFIEDRLSSMGQPTSSVMEAVVVFEEMFMAAVSQNGANETTANLTVVKRFGEVTVKLQYEGDRFQPEKIKSEDINAAILNAFRDKLFTGYRRGSNTITIRVQNCRRIVLLSYAIIFLLAIASCHIVRGLGTDARDLFYNYFVHPILNILLNAVLLISTPLAFFCLVKNIITLINANRRRTASGRIILLIVLQSLLAITLTMLATVFLSKITENRYSGYYSAFRITNLEEMVSLDFVGFFFPSGINDFFSLTKPFAFISLAIITALAICNSDEYYNTLQHAVESISDLLCKMLNIILTILPLAYFAAILDDILYFPIINHILEHLVMVLYVLIIVLLLFAIYCVIIKLKGGTPIRLIRESIPAIKENIRIGSSIDAAPYNIRFFSKKLRIPVKDLSDSLPILAQVSQAGNCLCFALISMTFLFLCGVEYTPLKLLVIAMISFFLGIGSPGQQGGILSGSIIINAFLGIPLMETVSAAIIWEILFGQLSTFINIVGDIVNVYIHHLNKQKKK